MYTMKTFDSLLLESIASVVIKSVPNKKSRVRVDCILSKSSQKSSKLEKKPEHKQRFDLGHSSLFTSLPMICRHAID